MKGQKPPAHSITSLASVLRFYYLLVRRAKIRRVYFRLLKTIYKIYFAPQWRPRKGRSVARKIPIDMELDSHIPFDPTWLACYLGFVRLWIGSLGWLHRRFGDRALDEIVDFLIALESLFTEADKVFSVHDSTLACRPGPRFSYNSLIIHLTDRNSFCFPSLHVMIVRFNALRMEAIMDRLNNSSADLSAEKKFLHDRSLRIVESIIHVKQHGLSDIPAGLFLLRHMDLGHFHADDFEFMDRLFPDAESLKGNVVRRFLKAMYVEFHARKSQDKEAAEVLVGFLQNYSEEMVSFLSNAPDEIHDSEKKP